MPRTACLAALLAVGGVGTTSGVAPLPPLWPAAFDAEVCARFALLALLLSTALAHLTPLC